MRARSSLLVTALAVAALLALAPTVSAHTQVRDASPAPGEEVTGTVDRAVLEFLDPVSSARIEVTGPDGEVVPGLGETEVTDDDVAEVTFDPLFEVGRYRVSYEFAGVDGHAQIGAHEFRFDEAGGTTGVRLAIAGVVAILGAGFVVAALRVRGRSDRS